MISDTDHRAHVNISLIPTMKTNETIRSKAFVKLMPKFVGTEIQRQLKSLVPCNEKFKDGKVQYLHNYENRYLMTLMYNGVSGSIDEKDVCEKWVSVSFYDENVKTSKRQITDLTGGEPIQIVEVDGSSWMADGRIGQYSCLDGWTIYDNIFPYSLFEDKKKGDVVTLWVPVVKVTEHDVEKTMDDQFVRFCDNFNCLINTVHNVFHLAMVKISIILANDIYTKWYDESVRQESLYKIEKISENLRREELIKTRTQKIENLTKQCMDLSKKDPKEMSPEELINEIVRLGNEIEALNKEIRPLVGEQDNQ